MNSSTPRRALAPALLVGLSAALAFPALAGHAAPRPHTAMPSIIVDSRTFAATLPTHIAAGLVSLHMIGMGQPWTGVSLGRLKAGTSRASVISALKKNDFQRLGALGVPYGGVGPAGTLVVKLPAGRYFAYDTEQQTPKRTVRYAYKFFVVGPSDGAMATPPLTIATITMDDMRFKVPATLPAGLDTIKMVDSDQVDHMAITAKIAKGKTLNDVMAYIKAGQNGPPPVDPTTFGGMNVVGPGQTAYLTQRYTPGLYVILCFVSDPKKGGELHVAEGMINHFVVR